MDSRIKNMTSVTGEKDGIHSRRIKKEIQWNIMSQKQEVITFKTDPALAEIIRRLPNSSDFIRKAVLNALESSCPLCQGSGIITPEQKEHWEGFLKSHKIVQCNDCRAVYIECEEHESSPSPDS